MKKKFRVNAKEFAHFDYPAFLDRKGNLLPQKNPNCPYDIGDVVVVEETQAIGVVLGCICDDGDLRTDVDGMRCWSVPGYLRWATKKDIFNKKMHISDRLLTTIKNSEQFQKD